MNINEYKHVEIKWWDHTGHDGWHKLDDALDLEPKECITSGYIVKDEPAYVVISNSLAESNDPDTLVSGSFAIDRSNIVYIKKLIYQE